MKHKIFGTEILLNDEMSRADELTVARGKMGIDLMENAGRCVFNVLRQEWTWR